MQVENAAVVVVPGPSSTPGLAFFGYCELWPGRILTFYDEKRRETNTRQTTICGLPNTFSLPDVGTVRVLYRMAAWPFLRDSLPDQTYHDESSPLHLAWQQLPGAVVSPWLMALSAQGCPAPNVFSRRLAWSGNVSADVPISFGMPIVFEPLNSLFAGGDSVIEFDVPFHPCDGGQTKIEPVEVFRDTALGALVFRMSAGAGKCHVDIILPDDPAQTVTPRDWTRVHRHLTYLRELKTRATILLPLLQIDTSFRVTEEAQTLTQRVMCNITPTMTGQIAPEMNTLQIDCRSRLFHLRVTSDVNCVILWGVFPCIM